MKAQMRFQKIMCLVMLIFGALALFYACAYLTGGVQALAPLCDAKTDGSGYTYAIDGAEVYINIQGFNDLLMYFGIVMILAAVLLYITSTHKRRKYYVTNYIATGVCAGVDIVLSIIAMIENFSWKAEYAKVDFEAWQAYAEKYLSVEYNDSTLMFNLGTVLFILIIVASLFLIFNLVWKLMNEKQEKKLLNNSVEVAAL